MSVDQEHRELRAIGVGLTAEVAVGVRHGLDTTAPPTRLDCVDDLDAARRLLQKTDHERDLPALLLVEIAGNETQGDGELAPMLAEAASLDADLHLVLIGNVEDLAALDVPPQLAGRCAALRLPLGSLETGALLQVLVQKLDRQTRDQREASLFRAMFDSLAPMMWIKDCEHRILYCSESLLELLGRPLEDVQGKTDADLYGEEHFAETSTSEREVVEQDKLITELKRESRLRMRMPLRGADGRVIGTFGISLQLPAYEKLREKLSLEQDLLDALLNTTPDKVYFKDLESRFLRCSLAHAKQFGFTDASMMIGKSDAELFAPEHARKARADESRIIQTGEPMLNESERITLKDGRVRWALTAKSPLRDRKGAIVGTFGLSKDITAQKQAEEELARTHAKLIETSRRAGMAEVATGVLHNVGNVLNSVNVSAAMIAQQLRQSRISHLPKVTELFEAHAHDLDRFLRDDPQGRQLPEFLQKLSAHLSGEHEHYVQELESLRRNIEHIKDIVAMQQSYAKVAGVSEVVSLVDLVEDALAINAAGLTRHQVSVTREYRAKPTVCVDKHKVLQVLVNLISNAKYACDGLQGRQDGAVTVTVDQPKADTVRIVVSDNGVGISAENCTKLFTHGFTTKKYGHGFGLHNSALAAKELGGTLTGVSDGEGCGATFTFEFPAGEVAHV